MVCISRVNCDKVVGNRQRLFANRNCYRLSRVSWALAQISCLLMLQMSLLQLPIIQLFVSYMFTNSHRFCFHYFVFLYLCHLSGQPCLHFDHSVILHLHDEQRCADCGCVSPRIQICRIFCGCGSCSVTKFADADWHGFCFVPSAFFLYKILKQMEVVCWDVCSTVALVPVNCNLL